MNSRQHPETRVRRVPNRAVDDPAVIREILRQGWVCHVSIAPDGQPYGLPMVYALVDDDLVLHGSTASRLMRLLRAGAPACITVTHVDGLVLARSAFHHSMNYRCAMLFGTGVPVKDPAEKDRILRVLVEALIPGRMAEARPPSAKELQATEVLRFSLDTVSAKVRTGPPVDDPEDLERGVWAGVLPLRVVAGTLEAAPDLQGDIPISDSVERLKKRLAESLQSGSYADRATRPPP